MTAASRIELGRFVKPVGIKGEVKLLPSADYWSGCLDSERLELESSGQRRPVRVTGSRPAGDCVVLRLDGVTGRDGAESLRDALLVLSGEPDVALPETPRPFQVIGLEVRQVGGEYLGTVSDLLPKPGQSLLCVRGEQKEFQIPFVEPILRRIDWEERLIEIDAPEGLLDL